MNVLVVNNQESIISSLNVEIIKTLRGVFSADELISSFTNFFFARMIIDVTALENSDDVVTYQKLSIGLPIDKIILLIPPDSSMANNFFLSIFIHSFKSINTFFNFLQKPNSSFLMHLFQQL